MLIFYHECGSPIWLESKNFGDGFLARFFDGRENGSGEKLTACPTCQKNLGETTEAGNYESVNRLCTSFHA